MTLDADVAAQTARRRTFAVISHPDAGKSTLTEALALHAHAIAEAGAVHGKGSRRGVVSDWLDMEQARGISITSAALQFTVDDVVLNLLDTPGHADFSEDTYRVLAAVDCAVMLLDAAKGLEPQTLKLFEACRVRGTPVITVINKWDRPGQEPLALLDEIEERLGIVPTPVNWPVGIAGDFRGVIDPTTGGMTQFTRTPGGATLAGRESIDADEAARRHGPDWTQAVEEFELLTSSGQSHDQDTFLAARTTPVLFAAAVLNFGVAELLDAVTTMAPPPGPWTDVEGRPRPVDGPFSGFVFKVQTGMDRAHRDRLAFMRVCSGRFERGSVLTHAASGRPFQTKYAQSVFGRERETIDEAYPGDVVGLVNAQSLNVGDTLYAEDKVIFPPLPRFAPEHFAVVRPRDTGRSKQFRRGIQMLDQEGVVQVLVSDRRGAQSPVLAAVGPMQFEVATHRLEHEFNAQSVLEPLGYAEARRTTRAAVPTIDAKHGAEVLERTDGTLVALFSDRWRMGTIAADLPEGSLLPLFGTEDGVAP
ncbi:peptide chain release factor 3 [Ornithinimicrobium sp. CNJ-824]|uniref:peptide chain release factor 3 n=1 Tax=Ornithinimicrobium sp. CNJ-824 TaxID=1904966 RepID=UPI000962C0C7|nr:peptide chain release factor 3 [Ornithinimicrobium sp. CNJ-824]OLT22497.1 peptide chain release factor 3 [Ornithinimicrobium sp. CNJ-824]